MENDMSCKQQKKANAAVFISRETLRQNTLFDLRETFNND